MQEILKVFESNSVSIGLIVVGVLFGYFKFWPWWTAMQAAKAVEEARRHDQFMDTIDRFTDAVNALNTNTHGMQQMIAAMVDKMDDHHSEVMNALKVKA